MEFRRMDESVILKGLPVDADLTRQGLIGDNYLFYRDKSVGIHF